MKCPSRSQGGKTRPVSISITVNGVIKLDPWWKGIQEMFASTQKQILLSGFPLSDFSARLPEANGKYKREMFTSCFGHKLGARSYRRDAPLNPPPPTPRWRTVGAVASLLPPCRMIHGLPHRDTSCLPPAASLRNQPAKTRLPQNKMITRFVQILHPFSRLLYEHPTKSLSVHFSPAFYSRAFYTVWCVLGRSIVFLLVVLREEISLEERLVRHDSVRQRDNLKMAV